jgi:hypothetical protein
VMGRVVQRIVCGTASMVGMDARVGIEAEAGYGFRDILFSKKKKWLRWKSRADVVGLSGA